MKVKQSTSFLTFTPEMELGALSEEKQRHCGGKSQEQRRREG